MPEAPRVVVVGDLMTDIVSRVSLPLALGSDTPARTVTHGGGSAANTACWLAAAGIPVALVARRGNDPLGDAAEQLLRSSGVTPRLAVDPACPTGTCIVLVDDDGERSMLPDRGANLALAPADLPSELFRPGNHLHLSGYVLHDGRTRPAGLAALDLARAAAMTVSIDPASAAPLRAVGAAAFLSWTRGATLCLPNLAEAEVLTGKRDAVAAARALASSYDAVVVTAGRAGAVWHGADGVHATTGAIEVAAVDTTGAGDAFAAGLLAAWLGGAAPAEALATGAALAARAVTQPGARPPTQLSP